MKKNAAELIARLPQPVDTGLRTMNRKSFLKADLSIVVLDDDPTGTQTVYDIPVLTNHDIRVIAAEFAQKTPLFYILTNSRALNETDAVMLNREISENLLEASSQTSRNFLVISRSDSTLRGHFPAETDLLGSMLFVEKPILFFIPAFYQGGRITLDGEHYVKENDFYLPARETVFAADASFGFTSSYIPEYIEEKSHGKYPANEVVKIRLTDIREGGIRKVSELLKTAVQGTIIVPDAVDRNDLEIFTRAFWKWYRPGLPVLFRTAASIVPVLCGIKEKEYLSKNDFTSGGKGILVVVGSYVTKSTVQLNHLIANCAPHCVELSVDQLIRSESEKNIREISAEIDKNLSRDRIVLFYTSRNLVHSDDSDQSLKIANRVSWAVIQILNSLRTAPGILIAKGGITSSDIATRYLKIKKAHVKGQILPGVPVWTLAEESRFPGMDYVIFPGNVGEQDSLSRLIQKLK